MRKRLLLVTLALAVALFAVTAGPAGACPLSPGYWMNHSEFYPSGIAVGGTVYTQDQVVSLMKHPTQRDMTYAMLAAVVAAQLSVANGGIMNDGEYWAYVACRAWMDGRVVGVSAPVPASSAAWQSIEHDYWTLHAWWDTSATD